MANVLGAERQEQVRRMNAEPAFKREVEGISSAIDRRRSAAEKADLRGGNIVGRGSALGMNREGATLRQVHERVVAVNRALRQSRDVARTSRVWFAAMTFMRSAQGWGAH